MLLDKDALLAAVNALPDATPADAATLLSQLTAAQAALTAEQNTDANLQTQLSSANNIIAAVKTALGVATPSAS